MRTFQNDTKREDRYGKENVMNVTVPKITMEDLICEYSKIVGGQMILQEDKNDNA